MSRTHSGEMEKMLSFRLLERRGIQMIRGACGRIGFGAETVGAADGEDTWGSAR